MVLARILLFLFLTVSTSSFAEDVHILKFATLVPSDTAWMNEINDWAKEVETKSRGRLKFKIYPGGVMGDEPDVIRKIRSQQLHGAFFTGYGIGRIYSPARVLEMPFLFKNTEESDYVRNQLMPEIERGFRKNGYELLGWPEVGFIHFFSKKPIRSLKELRSTRIWMWQGDPLGEAFSSAAGISPIPLSIIDVYTQLTTSHGSIDTVFNSPFGALAMQWHTKLKYASNIHFTNAIGSLVISNKFYNSLPDDLKQLLKQTGQSVGKRINTIARKDNQKSLDLLKQSGIEFVWSWNKDEENEMLKMRDDAAAILSKSGYIPDEYFNKTRQMLLEFKSRSTD